MKKYAFLLAAVVILISSCSSTQNTGQTSDIKHSNQAKQLENDPHHKGLNLIPQNRFTGKLVNGDDFDSADYIGKKILFAFFKSTHKNAKHMIAGVNQILKYETPYEFKVIGVSLDVNQPDKLKKFIKESNITFPVVLEDSHFTIAKKLHLSTEVTVIGLDNKHIPAFGLRMYPFQDMQDGEKKFLDFLKENLNIKTYENTEPRLGIYPVAPDFTAKTIDGKTVKLSSYRNKKAVLVLFFSPKCPHCRREMQFLRSDLYKNHKKDGFEVLAISVLPLEGEILKLVKSFKDTWPIIDDSKRTIRKLYSSKFAIPENFWVDKKGRIRFYSTGYGPTRENLYKMQVRKLLDLPNQPLLSDKHFNGVKSCMVCHEEQYVSWSVTPHAKAWETLEIKGEEFNVDCVGCHSIGMNDRRGWMTRKDKKGDPIAIVPEPFQNVQCEHCHGIGGPHKSKPKKAKDMQQTCMQCHTAKFSLHFDFHERIQKVNHSNAKKIAGMTEAERINLLKKVTKKPEDLFNSKIAYVGSDKCFDCHKSVHKSWKDSFHSKAFETLKKKGHETNKNCLECHTVGYGQKGGYQENLSKSFEGVGCESCHGPGEKHIATKKRTDIRSLGKDCPFCVLEQICMSCHDATNDPDFNIYKDLEKVKQYHKTK